MNLVLWGIFYLITGLFLLYFFIKEKKVVELMREKEDSLLRKIPANEKSVNRNLAGNILTVLALGVTGIFFFIIDTTPDPNIAIKNWGIYGVFAVNAVIYLLREQHEWVFLTNLVMLILGRLMFNILDTNFYIYLSINVVISLMLIYIFRKDARKAVTRESLRKKADPGIEITDELVEREKRRESSMGKALYRINTAFTAIILVGLIQMFYIGNYVIPTASMHPTIEVQNRVFANMAKYKFTSPKIGQIIAFKEPMANKLMYTKRLVGEAGQVMEITNIGLEPVTNGETVREEALGNIAIDGKVNEILSVRKYSTEGLMTDKKIYIPKKGDKIRLDKIIAFSKGLTSRGEVASDWESYQNGEMLEEMSGADFLKKTGASKGFKDIIGDSENYDPADITKNMYYTFLLKVEGREETVLPIMDLKYNDAEFLKLLNGEALTLNTDYYMAMGDNTLNSFDSRFFGYVSRERIKGELLLRWWPLNKFGIL